MAARSARIPRLEAPISGEGDTCGISNAIAHPGGVFVAPCFNEAKALTQTMPALAETFASAGAGRELVLVDNGRRMPRPRKSTSLWAGAPSILQPYSCSVGLTMFAMIVVLPASLAPTKSQIDVSWLLACDPIPTTCGARGPGGSIGAALASVLPLLRVLPWRSLCVPPDRRGTRDGNGFGPLIASDHAAKRRAATTR